MCYNQDFVNRIKSLWSKYKTDFAKLPDYITSMKTKLTDSQKFDEAKWPGSSQTNRNDNGDYKLSYENAIIRMKDSYEARFEWLDGKIRSLSTTTPKNSEWAF